MSHSDRDRRGRPHSGKRCPESQSGGCNYCITGIYKTRASRRTRHSKHTSIREQLA